MKQFLFVLLITLLIILPLTACAPFQPASDPGRGSILLWHDWTGTEVTMLSALLDRFRQAHPELTVISVPVPEAEIVTRYQADVSAGLGPDLVLTDAAHTDEMIEANLIRDLAGLPGLDRTAFLAAALREVSQGEQLFALPFAISTQVLFFNKNLVETPAATLDQLTSDAAGGKLVALPTGFADVLWGAQAFGGEIFDDQGRLALDRGGWVNWLERLRTAQTTPGFLTGEDRDPLRDHFLAGEAAYYMADARELRWLQEGLGADTVGVVALPGISGQRPAGPPLYVDAFFFSRSASPDEMARAVTLANFLTNHQQQVRLTTEAVGFLPANSQVRYDTSLAPEVLELARQSRTAVSIPLALREIWEDTVSGGSSFIFNVLEGQQTARAAILELGASIAARHGIEIAGITPEELCPPDVETRTLEVWHTWSGQEAAALADIAAGFEQLCSAVTIRLQAQAPGEVYEAYRAAVMAGGGPDLLIETTEWSSLLAAEGLIRDIGDLVDLDDLQPFAPAAVQSMVQAGRLYGIPESIETVSLFYNADLVEDPPATFDDLMFQVDSLHKFIMALDFYYAYFGLTAYGGQLYDENGNYALDAAALVDWLTWLQQAGTNPGMIFADTQEQAEDRFAEGDVAYFVGGSWSLANLRDKLGDKLRVARLPAGQAGPARPILDVESVMLNPNAGSATTAVSVAFARYLTGVESQQRLLATGQHVSANVMVDMAEHPLIDAFRDQATTASVVSQGPQWQSIWADGAKLYQDAVNAGLDPSTVADRFAGRVNSARPDEAP